MFNNKIHHLFNLSIILYIISNSQIFCLNNQELFSESKILTPKEKELVKSWFIQGINSTDLLYSVSRDGDSLLTFHKLCDEKGPTILIIVTDKGYKFGGFTSTNYSRNYENLIQDSGAFIFDIDKKQKYPVRKPGKARFSIGVLSGPFFGKTNLYIGEDCTKDDNNFVQGGGPEFYMPVDCGINGGSSTFKVKDYEVFSIK